MSTNFTYFYLDLDGNACESEAEAAIVVEAVDLGDGGADDLFFKYRDENGVWQNISGPALKAVRGIVASAQIAAFN